MFLSVIYQIILFASIHNKNTALSYLIGKKFGFSLSPEKQQKNSYKINQSQFHVINSNNMPQMRKTNDL